MCVTSPPYYGLRDYGVGGQLGLEDSPKEYIENMVDVFTYVHRVLKDDGILWLNIGDSYYNYRPGNGQALIKQSFSKTKQDLPSVCKRRANKFNGIKEKDLIGIPWMLAFALRDAGWYLRQDIIWYKTNPTPESVKDRCTKSHEYIFLFSKSQKYFFDNQIIRENTVCGKQQRNKRSVWTVATKPYKGSHFAVFPPDLIEPCILAGSKKRDVILDPFMGSGTTAQVALQNNRKFLGCELNREYKPLQIQRLKFALENKKV